eukprot:scaffold205332_cov40-Cyclotella_meneghiniana.AAC.2
MVARAPNPFTTSKQQYGMLPWNVAVKGAQVITTFKARTMPSAIVSDNNPCRSAALSDKPEGKSQRADIVPNQNLSIQSSCGRHGCDQESTRSLPDCGSVMDEAGLVSKFDVREDQLIVLLIDTRHPCQRMDIKESSLVFSA